ncbi:MAG: permease-like cell division protein FtsX [Clostridia bacterium]|nr:permease-like cell division protein FtsX [Clostridia bacterium]
MRYNILGYLIGEGFKNVFKNKRSTGASLMIMCATMLIFGVFFVLGENVNSIMKQIETQQGMEVFLKEGSLEKDIQELEGKIKELDGVNKVNFISKEDALNRMKEKLKDKQTLLSGYEDNNPFPASYVVTLTNLEKSKDIQDSIRSFEIVESITTRDDTINALINIANGIRIVSGGILLILIFISIFIIANTIKLTVYSRRKEISIMKYVGATNKFIRSPFIVEGIIIGIIAVLLSIVLLGIGYNVVSDKILNSAFSSIANITFLQFSDMFDLLIIVYLILGIGIGTVGSGISMKKYLQV